MKPFLAMLFLVSSALFAQTDTADMILVNGKVWTVDKPRPLAQAVAVKGGRILAVGSNDEIRRLKGAGTRELDLKGRLALPGFIDNHTHFSSGGFQLQNVDLRDAESQTEFAERIRARAAKYPKRWITGGDWDHDNWPGGELPAKELIDAFTTQTPVFVNRYDGHMALANSLALKLAGVTRETPDPPGGSIVRDPRTGEPTGVLKDEAMGYVYSKIPDPSDEELLDAVRLALAEARRLGLTTIQDMSSSSDVRAYKALQQKGELTARLYCRLPISQWERVARPGMQAPFGDEWIRLGSLKGFADGSLGSSTALFFEPFTSDPTTRGLPSDILQDGRLESWSLSADRAGLQLSIHAIGDSANSRILDIMERIVRENPKRDRRFRIEHAQHIRPSDFRRFAALGVVASVQPYHAIDDGRWAEKRIGHERCKSTYAFRSFLDAGVRMTFGSDWTVAPLSPILGIYAAVTRRTTDGANPGGWFPEQKITVQEAIEAYTINNAWAEFAESDKGSITPGKFADLVVLSDDILTIDPALIAETEVVLTIVGGAIVFEKAE